MPNINSNEFLFNEVVDDSSSLNNNVHSIKSITNKSIDIAKKWMSNNNSYMILPDTVSLSQLENNWLQFCCMSHDYRRRSDWESLSLFGVTNRHHYEYQRAILLKTDDADLLSEAVEDSGDIANYQINYNEHEATYKAIEWNKQTGKAIIYPVYDLKDLEALWDAYNAMVLKHRRESDWMSMEIFGITNLRNYELIKRRITSSGLLPEHLDQNKESITSNKIIESGFLAPSFTGFSRKYSNSLLKEEGCMSMANFLLDNAMQVTDGIHDDIVFTNIIADAIKDYSNEFGDITPVIMPAVDVPFFTPVELNEFDLGSSNYFGTPADNTIIKCKEHGDITTKQWREEYDLSFGSNSSLIESYSSYWVSTLNALYSDFNKIKESGNIDKINARKQSILELGWNPEIDFSPVNRIKAVSRIRSYLESCTRDYSFIDLRGLNSSIDTAAIAEASNSEPLFPVYITLVDGQALHSKLIKAVTNSNYSHAAISFDHTLKELFSFKVSSKNKFDIKKMRGGFEEESIDDLPANGNVGVFAIFLKKPDYDILKKNIAFFKDNVDKTSFAYLNFLTALFNVNWDRKMTMFCSQFVDRVLKMSDIDISHKNSSIIRPDDFRKFAENKKSKIYILYQGTKAKFNPDRISKVVSTLQYKAKAIKEFYIESLTEAQSALIINNSCNDVSTLLAIQEHRQNLNGNTKLIFEGLISPLLDNIVPVYEATRFPVEFDDNGRVIMRHINDMDFENEYKRSCDLIDAYTSNDNIDGMMFECSKLWMMNQLIERKIYGTPTLAQRNRFNLIRGQILDKFHTTLNYLQNKDSKTNFTEYYDKSPFSEVIYRSSDSALKYGVDTLEKVFKPNTTVVVQKSDIHDK